MTANPQSAIVHMTGPHSPDRRAKNRRSTVWRVAVVVPADEQALSTVYRCLSYRRAVSLSCNMARDRRLFLHMDALRQ